MFSEQEESLLIYKIGDKEFCIGLGLMAGTVDPNISYRHILMKNCDYLCLDNDSKKIPLLKIHSYFNEIPKGLLSDRRILIIDISGKVIGIWVDKINEVITIDGREKINMWKFFSRDKNSRYLGIVFFEERSLFVPDLKKIIKEVVMQ